MKAFITLVILVLLGGGIYFAFTRIFVERENQPLPLPEGYNLENYSVEKVTGESCAQNSDCKTPGEYLIQSRCPFTSLCLQNTCTIVCPAQNGWKTYSDTEKNISFQYPEDLKTTYIHPVDWPPRAQILSESIPCTEAGTEIERAGKTEKILVDTRPYCRTKISEGAAGSIYTQYAYAFEREKKTIIFTFTMRAVQCANYDDPQKTACENEQGAFDIDGTLDRIAQTFSEN